MTKSLWPDGIHCALVVTCDLDAETLWLTRNAESHGNPGILSQGAYGPKVGVPRLLAMMDRLGIKSTFFVPGWIIERYSDVVRGIVARGHEIGYHSYQHEMAASPEAEESEILLCSRIMREVLNTTPLGYRAPEFNLRPDSLEVLCRHGFSYSANLMDSDHPYLHTAPDGTKLVELPSHWVFDDSSHFFFTLQNPQRRPIAAPSQVREIWQTEFDGLYDEGGVMVLTLHPQIIGRSSRVRMLEQFLQYVQSRPGAWIAPAAEVARAALAGLR